MTSLTFITHLQVGNIVHDKIHCMYFDSASPRPNDHFDTTYASAARAASARGTLREAEKTAHRTGAARSPEEDDAATTCA
jgi:hypothetical protein